MSRFELSLSPSYVGSWNVSDAVREIFQNAIDQQTVDPDNAMFFKYVPETNVLLIGNKSSVLNKRSLLLGESTKADDVNTIGQFGEGYKIAALVLLRLKRRLTIYNYGAREVWTAKIVDSRRYGAKILVFDIDEKLFWQKTPDNDLTFKIECITPQDYADIVMSNLHLQDNLNIDTLEASPYGRILRGEQYKGRIYVNGLYVSQAEGMFYGYDIKPAYLELDRDRRLVKEFDLQWRTSAMWRKANSDELVLKLIKDAAPDVNYIKNVAALTSDKLAEVVHAEFKATHGENAVPVSNQAELVEVKATYVDAEPVIVNTTHKELVQQSPTYSTTHLTVREGIVAERRSPNAQLASFYKSHRHMFTSDMEKEFKVMMSNSENWYEEED